MKPRLWAGAMAGLASALAVTGCVSPAADRDAARPRETILGDTQRSTYLPLQVFFRVDSHALDQASTEALDIQARWLTENPTKRIRIEGNCDERGTREYNLALGMRRARATHDYLVARGIDPARIDVISNGKERPHDTRSSEDGWAINRNATTVRL